MQLAKTECHEQGPLLRVKKLYLLAALEMDAFKARMLQMGGQSQTPANPGSPPQHGSKAAHTLAGMCSVASGMLLIPSSARHGCL